MSNLQFEYKLRQKKRWIYLFSMLLLLVVFAVFSTSTGILSGWFLKSIVNLIPSLQASWHVAPLTSSEITILVTLRLPRVAMAIAAGSGLGICGTVMQAVTGNSMASPFTTGIASAAGFGAALVIVFASSASQITIVIAAFGCALFCSSLVYGISAIKKMGPGVLILTGVALNYLFSAMNSSLQYIANDDKLNAIVNWSFGNLTGATWKQVVLVCIIQLLAFPYFQHSAWPYNLLSSEGDESAKALGINVKSTRMISGLAVTLVAASIISFTGVIGFVGILAPHIARLLIGSEHHTLLPFSAVMGALLVLVSDTIGRSLFSPTIIPVGIVLSYVGVPLFIYLVIKEKRDSYNET